VKPCVYLETSAVLRHVLEGDERVLGGASGGHLVTSALTSVELERGLLRAYLAKRITAAERRAKRAWLRDLLEACEVINLDSSVLERAGQPFPVEPIRTLDALHLASAVLFEQAVGAALSILSVDDRVRASAEELGFRVLPETAA
jgi:predicted nucleic acid-binding protein